MMQKTIRWYFCLSWYLILVLSACSSTVKAPVDSRAGTPAAEPQTSYSQSNASGPATAEQRDYHIVARGDTLYSIAWRYGRDYRDVARWNDISGKYVIYPGQFIRLKAAPGKVKSLQPGPIISKNKSRNDSKRASKSSKVVSSTSNRTTTQKPSAAPLRKIVWRWPTNGKLVKLNTPTSKKGVDITGRAGQKVNAAAAGDVVYSGSGLLGYGKLIIIKHNETFLSAYAHNEKLYAKEGDKVKTGQQIATMGLGNKGRPILHFEIREDGTPVNPLHHLPRNRS